MKLENQVCSLELAKKLKELGIKQESYFYWHSIEICPSIIPHTRNIERSGDLLISAFTIPELIEILPAFIETKKNKPFNVFSLYIYKRSSLNIKYIAKYVGDTIAGENINNPLLMIDSSMKSYDEELANCLAKLVIKLKENNFI